MDPRDIVAPIKAEEPVYRIEIELESQSMTAFGKRTALQSGMALSANLILDRRSFADWLLQPIDGVRKRNR
jgi:membrane fusion protein